MTVRPEQAAFPANLLAGRTVLVTGGASGIGLEAAAQLLEAGATVVINGRSAERGEQALATLRARQPQGQVRFIAADVGDAAACATLFADIDAQGPLHGVLNCADAMYDAARGRFAEVPTTAYAPAFGTAVIPLMNVVHEAIPRLSAAGRSAIVTFASDSGKVAGAWQTMVGTTKAAIMMFTRSLALEVAKNGIAVNCVSPSYVAGTPVYEAIAQRAGRERLARAEAKAGLGLPEARDVARLAVFLVSPWASHLTGQVISVNGGITAA